jgi:hypothetical protein
LVTADALRAYIEMPSFDPVTWRKRSRVRHRRNFGDTIDESEVNSAEVSRDGMLNLRVYFPSLKQTREYGLVMQPDGTIRAKYNRNRKGEYSIRNGKFTANGNPTPPQHKCSADFARVNQAE